MLSVILVFGDKLGIYVLVEHAGYSLEKLEECTLEEEGDNQC